MVEAQGTLIAHCGAVKIDRQALALIESPPGTDTWRPVKHAELVNEIEAGLQRRHINVVREQFAVQTEGNILFAVLDLSAEYSDFRSSLGLRTSNNKKFRIEIVAGLKVFVCDNLAFNGESILLRRKHTSGLILNQEIDEALMQYEQQFDALQHQVGAMKQKYLSDDRAKQVMFDAVITRELMPVRILPKVAHEYFEPKHAEFKDRCLWSLNNSFTECLKEIPEGPRFRALQGVGKLFGELAG